MGISRLPSASLIAGILILTLSACGGEPIVFNGNVPPASSESSVTSSETIEASSESSIESSAISSSEATSSNSSSSISSISTSATPPQSSSSLQSSSLRSSSIASSSAAATGKQLYNSATLGCSTCHGPTGNGGTEQKVLNPADFTRNSLIASIKSTMPLQQGIYIGKFCPQDCAEKVADYILAGFPASAELPTTLFLKQSAASSTPAYSLVNSSETSCGVAYSSNDVRPLTKQEYADTIFQLSGIDLIHSLGQSTYDALPADNHTFSNADTQKAYSDVAEAIVNNLANSNFSAINCADLNSEQCYSQIVDQFACKAFKRPLTVAERNTYLATYTANTASKAGLEKVAKAILTSANFLYRSNIELSLIERDANINSSLSLQSAASLINQPKTLAIYEKDTLTGNFSGSDLLEISIKSTQSANGLWPVIRITVGESFVDLVANQSEATYKFQITGLAGSHNITIANQQAGAPLEYQAGHNLLISSVKLGLSY